jgi:hypothetical protein
VRVWVIPTDEERLVARHTSVAVGLERTPALNDEA